MTDGGYGFFGSSLRDLPRLRSARRGRASSWDRDGGNDDRLTVRPGETVTLADLTGPGAVTHIWCTVALPFKEGPHAAETDYLRRLVLRITWDSGNDPSVLVPLGDFFGVGHGKTTNFASAPLQMSPQDGKGFNCWFAMPFAERARIELVSELAAEPVYFYYYIDYESYARAEPDLGYFHAQWRRENPTDGVEQGEQSNAEFLLEGTNLTGEGNYLILDAEGRGHYVGCVLNVHNLSGNTDWDWYGEGDDMIFIDGESFPPRLHGTGTEDYFNTAWCPTQAYHAPYHGITLPGNHNWKGQISLYRFHIEDPVIFERSIRVTIEHGHANKRSDDISSVAYWYQTLPHRPFGLPPVHERLPRSE
ncbi:glycoside hydrolase family 172 protein [Amycolatopsis nigrescens]|uniref:glycoside hydrolase family 172 protein n=1 Tax=Amycolatopsis nigrescens TaxID=381445 RepID=UPI00036931E3|nr:glycoside hydrolase family 172 protein [Amycolatopsis nigrescens]